jgi:ASC-1-like (ASCH) protein
MKLKNDPFERIKSGKKIIEIRLYDEKRRKIKENDYIVFTNLESGEIIKVKVIKLHLFNTFKDLFDNFDIKYFGHNDNDKISYERMYDYYTKEEEKEYGVVGIEIKLVKGDE